MLKRFGMVASALALLALALAGCKNGMLGEDEATVNGLRDIGGGRTANVIITNFENDGKLRTIAPDQPDITNGDYVFVATGSANGSTMAPTKVTVAANGRVDLSSLTPGVWGITITAYSKTKLQAAGGNPDGTNVQTDIVDHAADAAVLSGSGTVDLVRSSAPVKITLTPRNIGTKGAVRLTVQLHQEDKTEIQSRTFTGDIVTIGLYNKLTGKVENDSAAATTEKKFNHTQAQTDIAYTINEMPKGEYTFQVTISDPTNATGPWTWSDNIYIEGNQDTVQTVSLDAIIGKKPAAPTNFVAAWYDDPSYVPGDGTYIARFSWDRQSYNERYFELQIADVTDRYDFTNFKAGGNIAAGGGTPVADKDNLWTQIEGEGPDVMNTYTYTLAENYGRTEFPIYNKEGSLLAANIHIEYVLQTGKVYAARIRSYNKNGPSDWVQLGTIASTSHTAWIAGKQNVNLFEQTAMNLFTITYNLKGYKLAKEGQNVGTGTAPGVIITNVKAHAYNPNTPAAIDYKAWSLQAQTEYQLYPGDFTNNAQSLEIRRIDWDSWVDEKNTTYTDEYDKYADIKVSPNSIAAGGGDVNLDVKNSGTEAKQLTVDTLLVAYQNSQARVLFNRTNALSNAADNIKPAGQPAKLGKVDTRYGVNIDGAGQNFLHFSVGEDMTAAIDGTPAGFTEGKLLDDLNRTVNVVSVTYTLRNDEGERSVTGTPYAVMDLAGLGGDYTLYVEAKAATNTNFTYQTPFVVKTTTSAITP